MSSSFYGPYVLNPYYFSDSPNGYVYNESNLYCAHLINTLFVVIFGTFLWFFVFYLILKKSPMHFHLYKNMLLLLIMMDAYMILQSILVQMRQKNSNGTAMVTFTGLLSYFGFDIYCGLMVLQSNLALFATSILPVQFIYRHYTVTRNRAPTISQLILWFCLSLSICLIPSYFVHETFCPAIQNPDNIDYGRLWHSEIPIPPLILFTAGKDSYSFKQSFRSITLLVYFSVALYFAWLTIKAMDQKFSSIVINENVRKVQKQLSRTLFAQLCIPLFTSILPSIIPVLMTHLKISTEYLNEFIYSIILYHPILNLASTILFIEPYFRFVRKHFSLSRKQFKSNINVIRFNSSQQTRQPFSVINAQ